MSLPTNLNTNTIVLGDVANSISEAVNALYAQSGFNTTVSSTTPLILTAASVPAQFVTGTVAQPIQLPDATTMVVNQVFVIHNLASAAIALTYNDELSFTPLASIAAGLSYILQVTDITTSNGVWQVQVVQPVATSTVPGIQTLVGSGTQNAEFEPLDVSGAELTFTGNESFYSENGNLEIPNFKFTYPTTTDTSNASFQLTDVVAAHGDIPFLILGDNGVLYLGQIAATTNVVSVFNTNNVAVTNADLSGVTLTANLSYAI